MLDLTRSTVRRAVQVRLPQVAASLTLTIALSIAPLIAVSFALFKQFPSSGRSSWRSAASVEKTYHELSRAVLVQFAKRHRPDDGGALFVLFAAVMLLLTLEARSTNVDVTSRARCCAASACMLMLAVGPVLVGASLWLTASLLGVSIDVMRSMPPWLAFALDLGPMALCSAGLAIGLRLLPNAPVRWRHAIVGGALGGIALELGKRGFAAYLIHGPIYQSLYGAFATLPVFLLWVYFSCLVTLSAALVAAQLGRTPGPRGPRRARQTEIGPSARLMRARRCSRQPAAPSRGNGGTASAARLVHSVRPPATLEMFTGETLSSARRGARGGLRWESPVSRGR
jgi:membrane protein